MRLQSVNTLSPNWEHSQSCIAVYRIIKSPFCVRRFSRSIIWLKVGTIIIVTMIQRLLEDNYLDSVKRDGCSWDIQLSTSDMGNLCVFFLPGVSQLVWCDRGTENSVTVAVFHPFLQRDTGDYDGNSNFCIKSGTLTDCITVRHYHSILDHNHFSLT